MTAFVPFSDSVKPKFFRIEFFLIIYVNLLINDEHNEFSFTVYILSFFK